MYEDGSMSNLPNSGSGDSPIVTRREPPVVSVVSTSTSTALRVDYDGRHPPLELFFVWTSLGWKAPVPASPPRDAIDWSTPDVERGTRHTILPFRATGTATLDTTTRHDADTMVSEALAAASRLGCRVDQPEPTPEIDLRDEPVTDETTTTANSRGRRSRGALARVRAVVPAGEVRAAEAAGRHLGADVTSAEEPDGPSVDGEPGEARARVTFAVPASAADAAMKALGSLAIGTPTIEIVSARDLAGRRS
jgi:hypothetical protein